MSDTTRETTADTDTPRQLDTTDVSHAEAPCRNCGAYTPVRVEGKPYCSMGCINERRREIEKRAKEIDL